MTARRDQIVTLAEAVAEVGDGAVVGLGGAVTDGHPMALVRALARRDVKDLTVVAPTGGIDVDLLIACGCVREVVTSYVGIEAVAAVCPSFRAAAEDGSVRVRDLDEAHCVAALRAAAQGLPFLPWRGGVGTSLPEINAQLVPFQDPVAGQLLLAVPALELDFALVSVAASDAHGNVRLSGTGNMDALLGAAAERVIVQAERIVTNEEIRRDPARTRFWASSRVVRCPWGTHPYSSDSLLADTEHLRRYANAARSATRGQRDELADYLQRHVSGVGDHGEYLDAVGASRLAELVI